MSVIVRYTKKTKNKPKLSIFVTKDRNIQEIRINEKTPRALQSSNMPRKPTFEQNDYWSVIKPFFFL